MNMLEPTAMPKAEFRNPAFLLQHIRDTMRFY
ncbi:MAG: D-mannose isomerase, partial [Collimonas fungivorans]|nr:D-mannose isomerase [Collimonas fungivorans]